jgi:2-polyprenyl-6-methoxyphenol hydroxylase-like FAD-dependent oxidoreductase
MTALAKEIGGWRVSLSDGTVHTAHFAVDATGRVAALARQCRLRPIDVDRLVGCCLRTRSRSDGNEGLMVESFADGWWYSAALPGGDRILACMTDADRVRPLELSSGGGFARLLAETKHVRRVAVHDDGIDRPTIWPAASRFFDSTADLPLLCVGDAALCFDPISGQGILAALRSGIFANYAIGDWLRRGDPRGLARYRLMQQRGFSTYCRTLHEYYPQEQRWPDSLFWRRRNERCLSIGPRMPGSAHPNGNSGRRRQMQDREQATTRESRNFRLRVVAPSSISSRRRYLPSPCC